MNQTPLTEDHIIELKEDVKFYKLRIEQLDACRKLHRTNTVRGYLLFLKKHINEMLYIVNMLVIVEAINKWNDASRFITDSRNKEMTIEQFLNLPVTKVLPIGYLNLIDDFIFFRELDASNICLNKGTMYVDNECTILDCINNWIKNERPESYDYGTVYNIPTTRKNKIEWEY
jgi:hypothetical protein